MGHHAEPEAPGGVNPVTHKHLQMEPAHPDDGFALGPSLRDMDKEELRLTWNGPDDLGLMLSKSIEVSDEAFTISTIEDNVIHGVWGHGMWESGAVRKGMGYIWMLTDDTLFAEHALAMTSYARKQIFPYMDVTYPMYGNFVMSKNLVHVRWLTRSGFKRTVNTDINGEAFSLYLRTGY